MGDWGEKKDFCAVLRETQRTWDLEWKFPRKGKRKGVKRGFGAGISA